MIKTTFKFNEQTRSNKWKDVEDGELSNLDGELSILNRNGSSFVRFNDVYEMFDWPQLAIYRAYSNNLPASPFINKNH